MYSVSLSGLFVPTHITVTANRGDTVHLDMQVVGSQRRDVTWKHNGESTSWPSKGLMASFLREEWRNR